MDASEATRRLRAERERLEALRRQGEQALDEERAGDQGELTTIDQHPADAATNLHDREVNESVVGGFDVEIAEIDAALERVDDGTYGRCEVCGQPLPDERLEVVPAARYCTVHQEQQEGAR